MCDTLNAVNTVTRFRTDPVHFEPCKTNVCFLFIAEAPVRVQTSLARTFSAAKAVQLTRHFVCPQFVLLDPNMVLRYNQTLFRCKDRRFHFPDLKGIIFNVKDAVVPFHNARCIYGGNQCTFDGMVDFISQHSTPESKYRFGVTGIMFIMPHRISRSSKPTVPIMDGKMVIVGPRSMQSSRTDSFKSFILPFELSAWLSILGVVIFFVVLWVLAARAFTGQVNLRSFVQLFVGDYNPDMPSPPDQPEVKASHENSRLLKTLAISILRSSFKVFLTASLIFYELLIAYHIFDQRTQIVTVNVQGLSIPELRKYIVVGGSAQEFVFKLNGTPHYLNFVSSQNIILTCSALSSSSSLCRVSLSNSYKAHENCAS